MTKQNLDALDPHATNRKTNGWGAATIKAVGLITFGLLVLALFAFASTIL